MVVEIFSTNYLHFHSNNFINLSTDHPSQHGKFQATNCQLRSRNQFASMESSGIIELTLFLLREDGSAGAGLVIENTFQYSDINKAIIVAEVESAIIPRTPAQTSAQCAHGNNVSAICTQAAGPALQLYIPSSSIKRTLMNGIALWMLSRTSPFGVWRVVKLLMLAWL